MKQIEKYPQESSQSENANYRMKSIDIPSRLSDGQIQALPRHTKIQPQASKHPKKLKMSDLRGAEKTVFYFLIKNMQRLVVLGWLLVRICYFLADSEPIC